MTKSITSRPNSFISYLIASILLRDPLKLLDGCSFGNCFKFTVIMCDDRDVVEWYLAIRAEELKSSLLAEVDKVQLRCGLLLSRCSFLSFIFYNLFKLTKYLSEYLLFFAVVSTWLILSLFLSRKSLPKGSEYRV